MDILQLNKQLGILDEMKQLNIGGQFNDYLKECGTMESVKLERGQKNFTVEKCHQKKDKFRFDLSIQRNQVWKKDKKSLFIHSMLLGYPLADIYTMDQDGDNFYWVLDGKQRLTTFFDFLENKFALEGEDIDPINGETLLGKTFEELSEELKNELLETKIVIQHFKNLDREQRDKLFFRLNNGEPLSKMEQTRALSGEFMDRVVEVLGSVLFKDRLRMSEKTRARFKDVETVLQTLMVLEQEDNFDGLGSVAIREYVKEKKESNINEEVFNRLYKTAAYIEGATADFKKKELKLFKKTNIPVIVKIAEEMKDRDMDYKYFGSSLAKFFEENGEKDGEYVMLLKAGSSKKENVLRRIEIMQRFMSKQLLKREMLEEKEINEKIS